MNSLLGIVFSWYFFINGALFLIVIHTDIVASPSESESCKVSL